MFFPKCSQMVAKVSLFPAFLMALLETQLRRAKQLELSWWDTPFLEELVAADALDS